MLVLVQMISTCLRDAYRKGGRELSPYSWSTVHAVVIEKQRVKTCGTARILRLGCRVCTEYNPTANRSYAVPSLI